jgi:N-6 DNA methylase
MKSDYKPFLSMEELAFFEAESAIRGSCGRSIAEIAISALVCRHWLGCDLLPSGIVSSARQGQWATIEQVLQGLPSLASRSVRGTVNARSSDGELARYAEQILVRFQGLPGIEEAAKVVSKQTSSLAFRRATVDLVYEAFGYVGDETARASVSSEVAESGLHRLILGLLNLPRGSSILNPTCGVGALMYAFGEQGIRTTGIEVKPELGDFAQFLLCMSETEADVRVGDALESLPWASISDEFNAYVVDPPWGTRLGAQEWFESEASFLSSPNRLPIELAFLIGAQSSVRDSVEQIVMVLPPGPLFSGGTSKEVRQRFLRNAALPLDAVITIPPVYTWARVECNVLVFRRSPQADSVSMIDVTTEIPQFLGSDAELSAEGISTICEAVNTKHSKGRFHVEVARDKIFDGDCSWLPRHYVHAAPLQLPTVKSAIERIDWALEQERVKREELGTKMRMLTMYMSRSSTPLD